MFEGALDWNRCTTDAYRNDKLDLVVEVPGLRRVRHAHAIVDDRVGWLEKEERRLAIGIAPHFAGVGGVVAPHAENPAYREACSRSVDSNRWNSGRRNYKTGIARCIRHSRDPPGTGVAPPEWDGRRRRTAHNPRPPDA